MLVRAERQEDADEVGVTALLEDLARQGEGWLRRVALVIRIRLAKQARGHSRDLAAVRAHDRHLHPRRGAKDWAAHHVAALRLTAWLERAADPIAPGARDIDEDVVGGQQTLILERPTRYAFRRASAGARLGRLDRRGRGRACGEPHHLRTIRL